MHIHVNHMFCLDSCWGGTYSCSFMVSINNSLSYEFNAPEEPDWLNLLDEYPFYDAENYKTLRASPRLKNTSDDCLKDMCYTETRRLKPKVLNWLEKNVKPKKRNGHKGEKAYAIGTDAYNSRNMLSFSIFFYRRSDAFKFVKRWSSHKKPTTYFDYFKMVRRELNSKTKTLRKVKEYTMAVGP